MDGKRPTIGLALGSGGARGFAHIGVIRALEEAGIPIDCLAGSSMGALVASMYGVGHSVETMERFATLFRKKYYLDFTMSKQGFVAGKKIETLIRLLAKKSKLEELKRPVAVVATDLKKGERVIFERGDVAEAVRASLSIPGIFVPVHTKDGRILVDGGVIDRVPVTVVKNMGAELVIAVDVSFFRTELQTPSTYEVVMQTMDIMGRELSRAQELQCDVMIRPILKSSAPLDFSEAEALIIQGEQACKKEIPRIQTMLKHWR
ncbi:patatin-like phospholipase family protein [Shouchella shacheensis]|uniref:patatin-like phospholipase family protein n=1 Tax=Shouchella shacheensis TaxID=1649580 RepID=UPI00074035F5|nr:patatin-like phospholipase family protein [Shouchella shacheensis]